MSPLELLRARNLETWCGGGGCKRNFLPSATEILQGLVTQSSDGSLSLRTSGGGNGGGGDGNVNIAQVGGSNVTNGVPVVNPNGSLVGGGLVPEQFTSVTQTLPAPSPEVEEYVYTLVGGGTATVTVTYVDSTKAVFVSAVRS